MNYFESEPKTEYQELIQVQHQIKKIKTATGSIISFSCLLFFCILAFGVYMFYFQLTSVEKRVEVVKHNMSAIISDEVKRLVSVERTVDDLRGSVSTMLGDQVTRIGSVEKRVDDVKQNMSISLSKMYKDMTGMMENILSSPNVFELRQNNLCLDTMHRKRNESVG